MNMRSYKLEWLLLLLLAGAGAGARAQAGDPIWLDAAYTYTDFNYQDASASQKGRLPGVRGEVGFTLFGGVAFSAGGSYQDAALTPAGESVTGAAWNGMTSNYVRDLRAELHLIFGSVALSGGVAQRYWYSGGESAGGYRQHTEYDYFPVAVTFSLGHVLYVRGEDDIWRRGQTTLQLSDVGAAAGDVDLTQNGGGGFGVELGAYLPGRLIATHLFAAYHAWSVKDSNTVRGVMQSKNTTTTIEGGIGLVF